MQQYLYDQAVFIYDQKVKAKTWISWERKKLLRWNKKYFSSLKGFSFAKTCLRPESMPLSLNWRSFDIWKYRYNQLPCSKPFVLLAKRPMIYRLCAEFNFSFEVWLVEVRHVMILLLLPNEMGLDQQKQPPKDVLLDRM